MEKQEAAGVLKNTRAGWRGAVDGDDNVIKTHSKIRTYMYVFPETWWNSDTIKIAYVCPETRMQ